jgi:hypothetical protein
MRLLHVRRLLSFGASLAMVACASESGADIEGGGIIIGPGGDVVTSTDTNPADTTVDATGSDTTDDTGTEVPADIVSDIALDDLGVPEDALPDAESTEGERLRAYCELLTARVCEVLYQCGAAAEGPRAAMEAQGNFNDEASCLLRGTAVISPACSDFIAPVDRRRYELDVARIDACRDIVLTASCESFFSDDPTVVTCTRRPPVLPAVPNGESCSKTDECESPLSRCSNAVAGGDPARDGVCESAVGAGCLVAGNCGRNHYCNQPGFDANLPTDIEGVCTPRARLSTACEEDDQCPDGAFCDFSRYLDPETGVPFDGVCLESSQ